MTFWLVTSLLTGCVSAGRPLTPRERAVAAAARPLLELDPNYVWSDCFNRLIELGPTSLNYLARQPAMREPAAPDDLRVMLHTSLMRLLADPATAPKLSVGCFETTFDVLHFDIKVRGRRPGTVVMPPAPPRAWHDLYPLEFDHEVAGRIEVEHDRQAMLNWWRERSGHTAVLANHRRFKPHPDTLWRLLSRRFADRWGYLPEPVALLCASGDTEPMLIEGRTYDYNLVRAACVLLGRSADPLVQDRLIELLANRSPVLSYNARFALSFSPDDRVRALIERYQEAESPRDNGNRQDAGEELPIEL